MPAMAKIARANPNRPLMSKITKNGVSRIRTIVNRFGMFGMGSLLCFQYYDVMIDDF
jgi:hypothetical protein